MGQKPNKYHTTDDGKIYIINDDGSFTNIGNVSDVYETHRLKETLSRQRQQSQIRTTKKTITHYQTPKYSKSDNLKTTAKVIGICIMVVLFLFACLMAIINS